MPKAGVTTEKVIQIAVEITAAKGLDALTLNEVSDRLGIKTPSLYKHISGLPKLRESVSSCAAEMLKEQLVKSVMGKSGHDALQAMGLCSLQFAEENINLYETIQWANVMNNAQSGSLFSELVNVIYNIASELGADELEASHIIRTVRSLTHGFASVSSHHGFAHDSSVQSSYEYALETFMLGVQARRERHHSDKNKHLFLKESNS